MKENEHITFFKTGLLEVNTYVVELSEKDCIVIDAGGNASEIADFIKGKNLNLKAVILTHGHFDHIGGIPELKQFFPDMKLAVHEYDCCLLGPDAYDVHMREFKRMAPLVRCSVKPTQEVDIVLKDGDEIFKDSVFFPNGFKVIHTPGHSKGSVCYYNSEKNILFSGDTLFRGCCGRTDLSGGNEFEMQKSLERLLKLPPETQVFPGHEGFTSILSEQGTSLY